MKYQELVEALAYWAVEIDHSASVCEKEGLPLQVILGNRKLAKVLREAEQWIRNTREQPDNLE